MKLEALHGAALEEADEILDSAAHDVAKYMAMTARNVDPAGDIPEDLASRMVADVRKVDGRVSAWELWQGFSHRLRALAADERLDALDAAMAEVRRLAEAEPVDSSALARIVTDTARRIASLKKTVRRRRMEARSR